MNPTKALAVALAAASVFAVAPAARAASGGFGPAIDSPRYEGQSRCSPDPKPGMVAFRNIVLSRYPGTGGGYISRACHVGSQSEHKEGRAWDWGVNAGSASDRAKVKAMLDWLLAKDRYGNDAALAKRFGIMYIIWDRKIWGSWSGWRTYCVQRRRGCVDPDDGGTRSPHTDHVHFSMSRAGAKKDTTYWKRDRSMLASIAAHPTYGYWQLGRNGGIASLGTGWYGSKSDTWLKAPAVAMASTPSGYGYWMVTKTGRVSAFGDAPKRKQIDASGVTIVDIEASPSGRGYWLLAKGGLVFAVGDAKKLKGARASGATFAGMAATPTGQGYWLFATGGKVFAFGDAESFGGLAARKSKSPVVGGDNFGALGYWLVTQAGRVAAFGKAPSLGSPKSIGPVVGFAAEPSGTGYWLMTGKGGLRSIGKAPALGSWGR